MATHEALIETIVGGDLEATRVEVNRLLGEVVDAQSILANGLIAGVETVGMLFKSGEMFLPEVIASAEAMHKGLDILKPLLTRAGHKERRIVMGTVEGDIHSIGKKIVCYFLEGSGCEVIDLGVDIKADAFARAVEEYKPDVLGMSALLTATMPGMERTINLLAEKGLRNRVKVIVGGAPVTEEFAKLIGADGYAPEAVSAVEWVKRAILSS